MAVSVAFLLRFVFLSQRTLRGREDTAMVRPSAPVTTSMAMNGSRLPLEVVAGPAVEVETAEEGGGDDVDGDGDDNEAAAADTEGMSDVSGGEDEWGGMVVVSDPHVDGAGGAGGAEDARAARFCRHACISSSVSLRNRVAPVSQASMSVCNSIAEEMSPGARKMLRGQFSRTIPYGMVISRSKLL